MPHLNYPTELTVEPCPHPVDATVTVPGSKSITNRALVLAALHSLHTPCVLTGALKSEDTEVMVECLRRLGFSVRAEWPTVHVLQHQGRSYVPATDADLFVANSGTTVRFLTALCAVGNGRYRLDGIERMRERPIQDLLDALNDLGVTAVSETGNGCPPVVVTSNGFFSRESVSIRAGVSSQFLSALLMVAPVNGGSDGLTVRVRGEVVSEPYIAMTEALLRHWGVPFSRSRDRDETRYHFAPDAIRHFGKTSAFTVEPDASSASYFWATAAVTGGRVTVSGLNRKSLQGDVRFVDVLAQMGCRVEERPEGVTVHGGALRGVDVDMNDISDTVMTLGAVACFADGPTTIRNVAHIRHKETDRIAALATELRKLGAAVEEREDGLTIVPRPLTGCAVDTYNDHRMAMSLALVGLRVPGVVIRNPKCVEKTYPEFWQDFAAVCDGK
ncbi:MAG TPA: 3-phosphoshikimate 1-carboxyvinyltransferase [Gemmata sp.]